MMFLMVFFMNNSLPNIIITKLAPFSVIFYRISRNFKSMGILMPKTVCIMMTNIIIVLVDTSEDFMSTGTKLAPFSVSLYSISRNLWKCSKHLSGRVVKLAPTTTYPGINSRITVYCRGWLSTKVYLVNTIQKLSDS